jgi:hypothetical protein
MKTELNSVMYLAYPYILESIPDDLFTHDEVERRVDKTYEYFSQYSQTFLLNIGQMLDDSTLFFMYSNDNPNLMINCNDLFYPGSDCELLEPYEIPVIIKLHYYYGPPGAWAYVYHKREYTKGLFKGSEGQREDFNNAVVYLKKGLND